MPAISRAYINKGQFDSLCDPPCCPIRFPADNCRLLPVDDVIFWVDMVCYRRFVLLRLWLFPGAS